jgi:hypothetical protein
MRIRVSVWFVALVLLAGLASSEARAAATPAIQTANPPEGTFGEFAGAAWRGTIGWRFTVGANAITVSQLGIYDSGGNGLAESHQIGIWTGDGSSLLTSTTVPAGTSATLSGAYRYASITPVTLNAGQTYVIGAFYSVQSGDNIIIASSQSYAPQLSFTQSRQSVLSAGQTFGFPNLDAGLAQGIFGPNFMLGCSATTVVTTAADSGAGSLRQAIADTCPGGAITFDPSLNGQTITLTSGELVIDRNLTITGPGANLLAVSGNNASRVFNIGAGVTVTLQRFAVSNGRDADAGGIRNAGILTVRDSAFTGNSPTNNRSAAIFNTGTLTVTNSTFTGNSGGTYGIIGARSASGPLTLEQVTLSGNTGRGVVSQSSGAATLRYVTLAQSNNATAVFAVGQAIRLESSSIASTSGGSACETISGGSFTSGGYNLVSDATCALSGMGDQNSVIPLLAALGNYGGSIQTRLPLPGSPAINAIPSGTNGCGTTIATDPRGIARPQGGACDIGAVESRGFTLTQTGGGNQSTVIGTAFANPLAVSVTSGNGEPVNGGQVTFTAPTSGASATLATSPATIASGSASVSATANATVGGPYPVTANTTGASGLNFSLTNTPIVATVALSDLGPYTYDGTPKSATCATTPAGLSKTLTYDSSATPPTNAGDYTVVCTVTETSYTGSATGALHIDKAATLTTITGRSPDPSLTGDTVTVAYTVTSTAGSPSGSVTVNANGGSQTCTAAIAAGSCGLTFATGGRKTLTATYAGDANFANSTSAPQTQQVDLSAQGAVPGGSGTITVRGVVSAGTDVSLTSAVFLAAQGAPASPPNLPPGVVFPYGLFAFTVTGLPTTGASASITFTLTYPDPLPSGTPYWKYGRTAAQPAFHWYTLPTTISNHQLTFSVTDGGQGDSDLAFDGSITDPGGPAFGADGVGIPTLSEWALLLLALLLGGITAMPRLRHWPSSRR